MRGEYLFGDSITSFTETDHGVEVTFAHAAPRTFDLVVGADGMHSNVRSVAVGPESDYVKHLGFYYVLAKIDTGPDDMMYNEPGRMVAIGGSKAPAFFVFASDVLPPARDDVDVQKQQVGDAAYGNALGGFGIGIRLRNLLFSALSLFGPLMKIVDKPASNIELEDYPAASVRH